MATAKRASNRKTTATVDKRLDRFAAAALATLALAMCACGNSRETSRIVKVGAEGWAYTDTISLLADTASFEARSADVAIAVRHTNGYEYSNIWVELTVPVGADSVVRDTVDMRLADDLGHWYGTGVGVAYQKVDTVARGIAIDLTRPVLLRHVMRVDTLAGIEQAGIILVAR